MDKSLPTECQHVDYVTLPNQIAHLLLFVSLDKIWIPTFLLWFPKKCNFNTNVVYVTANMMTFCCTWNIFYAFTMPLAIA